MTIQVPDPKDAFIPGQLLKTHPNGNREYTLDDGRVRSHTSCSNGQER